MPPPPLSTVLSSFLSVFWHQMIKAYRFSRFRLVASNRYSWQEGISCKTVDKDPGFLVTVCKKLLPALGKAAAGMSTWVKRFNWIYFGTLIELFVCIRLWKSLINFNYCYIKVHFYQSNCVKFNLIFFLFCLWVWLKGAPPRQRI